MFASIEPISGKPEIGGRGDSLQRRRVARDARPPRCGTAFRPSALSAPVHAPCSNGSRRLHQPGNIHDNRRPRKMAPFCNGAKSGRKSTFVDAHSTDEAVKCSVVRRVGKGGRGIATAASRMSRGAHGHTGRRNDCRGAAAEHMSAIKLRRLGRLCPPYGFSLRRRDQTRSIPH